MQELTQTDLDHFLKETTGTSDLFDILAKLSLYGPKEILYKNLKIRLESAMSYSKLELNGLIEALKLYFQKKPKKDFDSINIEFYQDKLHPVIMSILYAISEPFMLRSITKREILYLALKLSDIKNIFIGGIGCGEVIGDISRLPIIDPSKINIHGVDISASAIDYCNYRKNEFNFNTAFSVQDLDSYKLDKIYDLSELSEVIEHVRNPKELLANVSGNSRFTFVTIPVMLDVAEHLHLFNIPDIFKMISSSNSELLYYSIRVGYYVKQAFFFGLLKNPAL